MGQYRKKPVVIEAVRNDGTWPTILAWLDSVGYGVPFLGKPAVTRNQDGSLNIATLEGVMRCDVGDWLIQGVKDEFYPRKPDIFEATCEPVVTLAPLIAQHTFMTHVHTYTAVTGPGGTLSTPMVCTCGETFSATPAPGSAT
jgi:hypothetical protein